jgi:type IV secretion system protein TrbL
MGAAASTSYRLGQETSGSSTVGAGMSGVASAGAAAAREKFGSAGGIAATAERGQRAALLAGASGNRLGTRAPGASDSSAAPEWARRLRSEQAARQHRHAALQAIRDGDRGGAAANPDISEKE